MAPLHPNPEAFQSSVESCGGRVDFVFGDNRPFAQCHASTLAEADDGALLCAWFGGTSEGNPDVGIWLSRFAEGVWSAPRQVAKVRQSAHWNPVLFHDPRRGLFLFFKVGPDVPRWQTYWTRSDDNGATWTDPVELVHGDVGGRGPVRNKPIILSNGAWLAPASTELGAWLSFADCSEDVGKSWQRSDNFPVDTAVVSGKGTIQPTFWESEPGHVHALLRTTGGCIARTDSADYGRTWGPAYDTGLPNNNSGIDALGLGGGRVLLVFNPVAKDWGPRSPLNLAQSHDNGASWQDTAHLETEAGGEFSYPAIIRTASGIALCYTWKRERVRCWQIPLAAL